MLSNDWNNSQIITKISDDLKKSLNYFTNIKKKIKKRHIFKKRKEIIVMQISMELIGFLQTKSSLKK